MKRIKNVLLCVLLLVFFAGCGKVGKEASGSFSDTNFWRAEAADKENMQGFTECGIEDLDWVQYESEWEDNKQSVNDFAENVFIQRLMPEDVAVNPEIAKYDYESACKVGEVKQFRGILPGTSEGIWYIITIEGVEYYYARYDEFPDRAELMGYSIIIGEYSLENGISVGMTKTEVLDLCPAMAILDTEGNPINEVVGYMGWSGIAYPYSPVKMDEEWDYGGEKDYYWKSQFNYIMIADVEQGVDALPLYLTLMMKDDKVSAITFYCPTAG